MAQQKLSTLIRQGTNRPQGFGSLTYVQEGVTYTCAFGGALEAFLGELSPALTARETRDAFREAVGATYGTTFVHPVQESGGWSHVSLIISLNDDHLWSKERIADYFESQGY